MLIVRVLGRVWIPLVVLLVIVCGAFVVSRIHGVFDSDAPPPAYTGGQAQDSEPFNPKQVVYEVFGPEGTVADINYMDVNSEPRQVNEASLPWSVQLTTSSPTVVGSILAQGNSGSIGCRILVNGEVKAERVSKQVNAYTYCLVNAA